MNISSETELKIESGGQELVEERLALTATLRQLSEVDRYNRWVYEQFAAYVGRRVLEVGSGTGNITQFLVAGGCQVIATDVVPNYRDELRRRLGRQPHIQIGEFDLTTPAPAPLIAEPVDTVVCLNVLEHIEDDLFALEQMRRVLVPGGHLALLVPAHQLLYGEFDRAVGHFRRYGKKELAAKLIRAGFAVCEVKFFNLAAVIPWLINGRLLKRAYLPEGQVNLADRLVPLLKLERLIGPPCGISVIAIAQKQ
jgi:SAM-dependent methyltransferase